MKLIEKRTPIEVIQWNGFASMPELVEMKGDAINILLRHDESVVIFDNGYFLDKYIIINKGDWIARDIDGVWHSIKNNEISSIYEEILE
jgi:hypothetical protein